MDVLKNLVVHFFFNKTVNFENDDIKESLYDEFLAEHDIPSRINNLAAPNSVQNETLHSDLFDFFIRFFDVQKSTRKAESSSSPSLLQLGLSSTPATSNPVNSIDASTPAKSHSVNSNDGLTTPTFASMPDNSNN